MDEAARDGHRALGIFDVRAMAEAREGVELSVGQRCCDFPADPRGRFVEFAAADESRHVQPCQFGPQVDIQQCAGQAEFACPIQALIDWIIVQVAESVQYPLGPGFQSDDVGVVIFVQDFLICGIGGVAGFFRSLNGGLPGNRGSASRNR